MALTPASRRLRLLVRTRRDIRFPTNPKMKDRQYMMVRAIVLGSCRVQSSMLSRSARSLGEKVDRVKGKEEEDEGREPRVDACWNDEVEAVENKGEEMREEGSREGRG